MDSLAVSLSHLDNEARQGKIQRACFGTGRNIHIRYRLEDLKRYIDAHVGTD